jgi:hypothetical protein
MKPEGVVIAADAFMTANSIAASPITTSTAKRAGWRAISAKLFDNSVTSFCLERVRARQERA